MLKCLKKEVSNFYPRPPRGGRPSFLFRFVKIELFLSTPSARRATKGQASVYQHREISIHALREEGDLRNPNGSRKPSGISIHALREEGDPSRSTATMSPFNFYPRPPRGGRQGNVEV